jgi:hypothetical protein
MVSIDWRARLAGAERLDDLILGRQEANDNLISRYFNDEEFRNLLTDAILAFSYQQAREPESPVKAAAD